MVDDGSTAQRTLDELQRLARQPRVRVVRTQRNGGPAAARNLGLDASGAEWVGFLDADDLWPHEKLRRARAVLENRVDARWLIGDTGVLGLSDAVQAIAPLGCWKQGEHPGERRCQPELTRAIISNGLHLGACLVRRDAVRDLRFDKSVLYGEDILFLAKLSLDVCADRAPGAAYVSRRQRASLMWSAARLSDRFASGPRAGFRDPALRAFRREYRWALLSVYKDMAVNNLINGRRRPALLAAWRALLLDPRDMKAFAAVAVLLFERDRARLAVEARRYSRCEQVFLNKTGDLDRVE